MCQVSGVQQEFGLNVQRPDLIDRGLQGACYVGVRRLVESEMAVADLNEAQAAIVFACGVLLSEGAGAGYTGFHGPDKSGACPYHALQEAAAIDSVVVVIMS